MRKISSISQHLSRS